MCRLLRCGIGSRICYLVITVFLVLQLTGEMRIRSCTFGLFVFDGLSKRMERTLKKIICSGLYCVSIGTLPPVPVWFLRGQLDHAESDCLHALEDYLTWSSASTNWGE